MGRIGTTGVGWGGVGTNGGRWGGVGLQEWDGEE